MIFLTLYSDCAIKTKPAMNSLFLFPLIASCIGLIFCAYLIFILKKSNESNDQEKEAYSFLKEGLETFLQRHFKTIIWTALIIVFLLFLFLYLKKVENYYKQLLAFLLGIAFNSLSLIMALHLNIFASQKTIAQIRNDIFKAENISVSGGALSGLIIVSISIMGLMIVFLLFGINYMLEYLLGSTIISFFFRVGGGMFTTIISMGFSLVNTQDENIPYLDRRNPGTFANILGGHINEVAGLGIDLLNSFIIAVIAGMLLVADKYNQNLLVMPLLIAGMGIIATIMGILFAKILVRKKMQNFLLNSVYLTAFLTAIGSFFIVKNLGVRIIDFKPFMGLDPLYSPFFANIIGLVTGVVIGFTSEYFTSSYYKPLSGLTYSTQKGSSIVITHSVLLGMKTTVYMALAVSLMILFSLNIAGYYGMAMSALGMLATIPIIISLNAYRPIADNCRDMTIVYNYAENKFKAAEKLSIIGTTTAAVGRGFANGAATISALLLLFMFAKFSKMNVGSIKITDPFLLIGLFLGGMTPYLYSSLLLKGVLNGVDVVIDEIIRQFREIPFLKEAKAKPDVIKSVDLLTIKSLEALKNPGLLILFIPVIVGLVLGKIALAGLLIGILISGLFLAYYLGNSGVLLSNLCKYIENNRFGGVGTCAHEASKIGSIFGNPLQNTLSPSINILMILTGVMAILVAPFI